MQRQQAPPTLPCTRHLLSPPGAAETRIVVTTMSTYRSKDRSIEKSINQLTVTMKGLNIGCTCVIILYFAFPFAYVVPMVRLGLLMYIILLYRCSQMTECRCYTIHSRRPYNYLIVHSMPLSQYVLCLPRVLCMTFNCIRHCCLVCYVALGKC